MFWSHFVISKAFRHSIPRQSVVSATITFHPTILLFLAHSQCLQGGHLFLWFERGLCLCLDFTVVQRVVTKTNFGIFCFLAWTWIFTDYCNFQFTKYNCKISTNRTLLLHVSSKWSQRMTVQKPNCLQKIAMDLNSKHQQLRVNPHLQTIGATLISRFTNSQHFCEC